MNQIIIAIISIIIIRLHHHHSSAHSTQPKQSAAHFARQHTHTHTHVFVYTRQHRHPPSTVQCRVQTNHTQNHNNKPIHHAARVHAHAHRLQRSLRRQRKTRACARVCLCVCVHATEAQKFTFNETYNRIQEKKSKQRVCRAVHAHARMRARACRQLPALTSHFDRAARERENSRTYARTNACRHTHLMPTCLYIYTSCVPKTTEWRDSRFSCAMLNDVGVDVKP